MGPAVNSLGSYLRMPYGCGEQNMINFAPAVVIKRYLRLTNRLTPELDSKATHYMEIGYQRELGYQRYNGGYAAFGDRSSAGSTCLTMFVIRVYAQAIDMMYIDQDSLAKSVCWLMQQQRGDGSFIEPGHCSHLSCGRAVDKDMTLTAYGLITLVEVRKHLDIVTTCSFGSVSLSRSIYRAQTYLETRSQKETNDYLHAMTAYALALAKSSKAKRLLRKLRSTAIVDGEWRYWTCLSSYCRQNRKCLTSAGTVEATAYALLAHLHVDRLIDVLPIRNWLLSQMNGRGGYRSTQDTVVAFMALAESALFSSDNINLNISLTTSNSHHNFSVTKDNKLLVQQYEIDAFDSVSVESSGEGSVIFQATVNYHVPEIAPDESFDLTATSRSKLMMQNAININFQPDEIDSDPFFDKSSSLPTVSTNTVEYDDNALELEVCLRWRPVDIESGMALIEISMLSGFKADRAVMGDLLDFNDIDLRRYETEGRKLILYFDQIVRSHSTCFNVSMVRTHCVAGVQPGYVKAYSYYNPEFSTMISYMPPATVANSLDSCELPEERTQGESGANELEQTVEQTPSNNEEILDAL
ncbi:C3 and PZP-like alpha-2-macroglobulin domain-containing protein 8 [Corticium candelabrum]|uniref:C3 and PZP-like alpha-2-macroglobulin domain-containing protein 8 n=1 Tax=Corticium candelabrum TaxID=121492 RepID=UPI002E26E038|nr:C3 and PZP-like alpha-2-macroglobulin domain-containing protein 8 [Corticium candelabrum]